MGTHTMTDDTLYRIGDATNKLFIDGMIQRGTLEIVNLFTCYDCGVRSPDEEHFQHVNREKPGFNYPGSDGDLACAACAEGHAEWFKEH